MTFKQYVQYELKYNPFFIFSSLFFGVGGWLFGFILGLITTNRGERFYETHAMVFTVVVAICLFVTYDRLRMGYKLHLMRERQVDKEIARINGKLWDGAER